MRGYLSPDDNPFKSDQEASDYIRALATPVIEGPPKTKCLRCKVAICYLPCTVCTLCLYNGPPADVDKGEV